MKTTQNEAQPPDRQSLQETAQLPRDRTKVRVAEVPYPTSNSGVALKAKVSLVREPWE